MSGTLGLICSDSRLDLGAVDPQDAARAAQFQKKIAPEVAKACKAEARVAEARAKVASANQAAIDAGIKANQQPTPANEKLRTEAQANQRAALGELKNASEALEKIRIHLSQLKDQFFAITKSGASTPVAVRLAKAAPSPAAQKPQAEEVQETRAPVLRDHQVGGLRVKFQLSAQEKRGLKGAQ